MLFAGTFLLYALALPSQITWGDGPELAAAAWVLGVPHPTGYGLYTTLLHCAQSLPLGPEAWRGHLFSALCMAGGMGFLHAFLRRMFIELRFAQTHYAMAAATLSTLACSLTPIIWQEATQTEVYALFVLLFTATLWLLLNAWRNPSAWLPPLAFVIGLQLVHHRLSVFLIAAVVLAMAVRLLKQPKINFRTYGYAWISLLIPLLWLAYFPLRAMHDPPINWYDPDTFLQWWLLISGAEYAGILGQGIQLWAERFSWSRLLFLLTLPWLTYSALSIVMLIGLAQFFRQSIGWAVGWLALYFIYQLFLMFYPVGDWTVFLTPLLLLLTVPLSFGLAQLIETAAERPRQPGLRYAGVMVLAGMSLLPFWVAFDQEKGLLDRSRPGNPFPLSWHSGVQRFEQDDSPARFAETVWQAVPDGAPVITGLSEASADNELHPVLYNQIVLNQGANSPVIGAGFLYLDWYRTQLNRQLDLALPLTGNQKSLSRKAWLDEVWTLLLDPLLERGPVYSTSYPLPPEWNDRIDIEVVAEAKIDRLALPKSYRAYVPRGYVLRIERESEETP